MVAVNDTDGVKATPSDAVAGAAASLAVPSDTQVDTQSPTTTDFGGAYDVLGSLAGIVDASTQRSLRRTVESNSRSQQKLKLRQKASQNRGSRSNASVRTWLRRWRRLRSLTS